MSSPSGAQPSSIPVPPLSDPELHATAQRLAHAMQRHRDPDASLDVPPPSDIGDRENLPPDAKDPYIGTTFDHRYKIEQLLGEGGMGFVYLARHKVIDKKVAVKVLRADLAKDREILDRFLQEAKSASSIGNPHIVDISDFGDLPDGSTYFVMEHLEGKSLAEFCDGGQTLSVDRLCHIGMQIADGLAAAHQRGIVHRDLKPDNIFLIPRGGDPDFVKILDFGIAKVQGSSNTKLTKAGAVFGTPHYMSPEQAAGAPVDHRADIYALGIILYELMAGQLPFNADNFMGILTQHMYKAPVPIRALVPAPDCPPSFEAVVLKCLSKKPEARYASMEELAADLQRVKTGGVPHAVAEMMARSGGFNVPADYFKHPAQIVPATPKTQPKSSARIVWIAGAVAAVAIVGAIFVVSGNGNARDKLAADVTARATAAAPAPSAPVAAAPTATATQAPAAPPVKKSSVTIAASPDSAVAVRDGQEIQLPASIDVEQGKKVTIEIKATGYDPQTLELDGTEVRKTIKLKPVKGAAGPARPPGKGGGRKSAGAGDVVDPWGH